VTRRASRSGRIVGHGTNFGALPMGNGLARSSPFYGKQDKLDLVRDA